MIIAFYVSKLDNNPYIPAYMQFHTIAVTKTHPILDLILSTVGAPQSQKQVRDLIHIIIGVV